MASTSPTSSSLALANQHAHDHLTTLPSEILQQISSYLYTAHDPDQALHALDDHHSGVPFKPRVPRDLANYARASKRLYQQANAWAHLHLHTHRAVTKYRVYKTPKAAAKQLLQAPLQKLLQWTARHCVFCGKTSSRTAILMNGLNCCRLCDREQWPDKITDTEARKQYKLFRHRYPMQSSVLRREVPSAKLRYGTYFCMGVCTTMYVRKDLEAFEDAIRESVDPAVIKKERRRERIKTAKERKTMVVVIDDADDDATEVMERGGRSAVIFQEPIVIEDD